MNNIIRQKKVVWVDLLLIELIFFLIFIFCCDGICAWHMDDDSIVNSIKMTKLIIFKKKKHLDCLHFVFNARR